MALQWQEVASNLTGGLYRAKVPGGWLVVFVCGERSITFYPDPNHIWDGNSLP